MAIPHFSVAIIGRSAGRSAVDAAAYASRTDLEDERLGKIYRYGRRGGDVVFSRVMLPKGAPERLRDRAALWNEAEKAETRINSRTARRIIVALPHELTQVQQQQLLTDFVRENFTRKGLAVDMNIHAPDAQGDQRNDHAHLIVTTRTVDKDGIGKKDRASDEKATLQAWRDNWEKMVNRQLERYGHAVRISMKSLEAQGIDRMPQIHQGQAATALYRKGIETDRRDQLESIVNDNEARQAVANDNRKRTVGREFERAGKPPAAQQPQDWTAGMAFARDVIAPPANDDIRPQDRTPETIDRDRQDAEWQDSIDQAAIAYAEEGRQELLQVQATERATSARHGAELTARHAATWGEAVHRHAVEMAEAHSVAPTSYQPGTMEEAEQAVSFGLAFVVGVAASVLDSALSLVSPSRRAARQRSAPEKPKKRDTDRQEQQKRDQHQQEMSAIAAEQTRERESYERRRAAMLQDQQRARDHFEQNYAEPSALQQAFDIHGRYVDSYRAEIERMAARKEARQERERGGPEFEGPGLKP